MGRDATALLRRKEHEAAAQHAVQRRHELMREREEEERDGALRGLSSIDARIKRSRNS